MKTEESAEYAQKTGSAAKYLGLRGDRRVANSVRDFAVRPVPEIGKIYLLNEMPGYVDNGSPGKPTRMICRPIQYTGPNGCCIRVEEFRVPWAKNYCTFRVPDFQLGLIHIKELSDYVYTKDLINGYSWSDLDIEDPHIDIKKLYI